MLDEADQLLAPQFAAEVSRIAMHCGKRVPSGLQTIIVSATLNSQVPPTHLKPLPSSLVCACGAA